MDARNIKKCWSKGGECKVMKDDLQKGFKKGFWKQSQVMYLCVGVVNTGVGYGTIFVLLWLGIIPEVANFIGYVLVLVCPICLTKLLLSAHTLHISGIYLALPYQWAWHISLNL